MITRRQLWIGGALTTTLAGTGFALYERKGPHIPTLSKEQPHRVIRLAWPRYEEDALWVVAMQKGYFSRHNLEVQIVPGLDEEEEVIGALKERQADAAIASILRWVPALYTHSLSAKLVTGLYAGTFRIFVARGSKIDRISDLQNKVIGVGDSSPNGLDRLFVSLMLRRKGMNPYKDITWRQLDEDDVLPLLEERGIDAYAAHDPDAWYFMQENVGDIQQLFSSITGQYEGRVNRVLGVDEGFLEQDLTGVQLLVAALQQSVKWIRDHLKETSALLEGVLKEMSQREILRMLYHESQGIAPIGKTLIVQTAQYIDEFKLLGLLPDTTNSYRLAKDMCQKIF
ncbi:ABC transporter substrate-binding protein [Entomobacter blattae]|uniref:NMT1/THI5 like protein n=1 Tax=Entomobacter blattae TaxID=2762277 RepID=A0A7H1NU20_9PROT|nr:ABC transporter substrate-binding protein [Entomobacter blattae]QNT79280.1 NMT1/THI5 like protein [Entomobacter blattae]